ncbi:hypothetical protein F4803DRAFT_534149 [Xylaria telfairii]|nr:hypothetical protein F4803DRAFT_534149 [Xylaria telfairii]
MSGIEAVGLALGIIPLIISALEHYQDGKGAVSTWRQPLRVARSLIRNLKTEHGKLYNTCETLLGGIVSPTKLIPMLNEPFGPLWQDEDTKERIERRLDHMYEAFQETVGDMLATMEELKSNLGVNTEGQLGWPAGGVIKRYVMRASLVLNRASYDEALQELMTKNQTLETIVVGSLRLEPSRGRRSRGRYLETFRKIAHSIYKALQISLCRACPREHGVSLQLLAPRLSLQGDEESIIKKLDFRMMLSHHAAKPKNVYSPSWEWKEVKLHVDVQSRISKTELSRSRPLVAPMDMIARRVRISAPDSTEIINPVAISNNLPQAEDRVISAQLPLCVTDKLCQALGKDSPGQGTCAYVTDPSVREYGRFSVSRINGSWGSYTLTFICIRDMIEKSNKSVVLHQKNTPSLPQKLALASTIASGIFQLQRTPWLSMVVTSRTFYIMKFDTTVDFDRAYISRAAPEASCHHHPTCPGPCDGNANKIPTERLGNELMWALFVLLIEVILWRAMDDILSETSAADAAGVPPREIFDYTTQRGLNIVQGLLSKVTLVADQECRRAVETCLKLAFGYPNLDLGQEEVRQQVYGNIITPIEESAENSKTLTITSGGYSFMY